MNTRMILILMMWMEITIYRSKSRRIIYVKCDDVMVVKKGKAWKVPWRGCKKIQKRY